MHGCQREEEIQGGEGREGRKKVITLDRKCGPDFAEMEAGVTIRVEEM